MNTPFTSPRSANRARTLLIVLLAVVLMATTACSGNDDGDEEAGTASAEPKETTTTTIDPSLVAPLTGIVGTDAAALTRSALVVKIDNVEDARPPAGVNDADIVIEERVEGDVTRLLAVFHSVVPELVGPVRSTRSTDFDIVPLFGRPVYASSGGNRGVMGGLAGVDVIDVGHNRGGTGFNRESGRRAPHNLMATPSELYGRAGDEAKAPPTPIFGFREDGAELPATAEAATSVGFSFGGAEVSRFDWNATEGEWVRTQRGTPHVDVAGTAIGVKNVVALQINYTFGNPVGMSNPHGVTTGEGAAMVFVDGHVIRGTWSRPTSGDRFDLRDESGAEILLDRGQTFIELVPTGDTIAVGLAQPTAP